LPVSGLLLLVCKDGSCTISTLCYLESGVARAGHGLDLGGDVESFNDPHFLLFSLGRLLSFVLVWRMGWNRGGLKSMWRGCAATVSGRVSNQM
jgi:hypothetical protein